MGRKITVAFIAVLTVSLFPGAAGAASLAKQLKALKREVAAQKKEIATLKKRVATAGQTGPAGPAGPQGPQGAKGDAGSAANYLAQSNTVGSPFASGKAPPLGSDGRLGWQALPFEMGMFIPQESGNQTATAQCPADPPGPATYMATTGGGRVTGANGSITGSYPSLANGNENVLPNAWTVKSSVNGVKAFVGCAKVYTLPF